MSTPSPRPGTGRQIILLALVLGLGIALGVTFRDLILAIVGALVSAWAVIGERK